MKGPVGEEGFAVHPIDAAVLTTCKADFQPLTPLLKTVPKGTLYRHVKRLIQLGWLVRERGHYQTTDAGRRQLHGARRGQQWTQFETIYPPVKHVPTDVHRAVFELALAAVVCRQFKTRADRHPVFVCAGGTLRWKSSLGLFLCHALGLDPDAHLVECTIEVGKSLLVRRDAEGQIIYKRELLNTPLIVLDEFQAASSPVRAALSPLLSGRLVVPLENEQLTMSCVPLVLLNPVEKPTLEQRIALSAPLIRRTLIANLDAVAMPDLAVTGEQALITARAHKPLTLTGPAIDCQKFDRHIIDLLRAILNDDAAERIDLKLVANLCTGMTAWLPDPTESIMQVAHGVGILAETMAWTRPGWLESVTDFSLNARTRPRPVYVETDSDADVAAPADETAAQTIDFQIPKFRREPNLPDLNLSDALRGRLAWLAVETGRPVDQVLNILIDLYLKWQKEPETIVTLWKILRLARALDKAHIDVNELHRCLAAEYLLEKHHCRFEDIPYAMRFIECLAALPQSWNWAMVERSIQAVAFLMENGIESSKVERFLKRHQRLEELGFEEEEAEAVAEALVRSGAVGKKRTRVLNRMVFLSDKLINAAEFERERSSLEHTVMMLREEKAELETSVEKIKNSNTH